MYYKTGIEPDRGYYNVSEEYYMEDGGRKEKVIVDVKDGKGDSIIISYDKKGYMIDSVIIKIDK